ncbi:RNA polymerase sigma factor [Maioricimonas rarisocia]|uniref:RNA polymerase sigma factor n=1 Tax=Maioricimonas rarisocia TaxID=2528026 RepID=A0A517Z4W0_9PLAN|nr:ECF-type sigma factor [Maioricimonas rarisocia]QDU37518.1 RNA polymerase sigma factor [Maioricimonas rarisocia]
MDHASHSSRSDAASCDPFATTRWSVVVAARGSGDESAAALEDLCQAYWYPIYAYIRRRSRDIHEAQDLTQAFFGQILEQRTIAAADQQRGRFRAFLLTACRRFLINESERTGAAKRGGGRRVLSLDFELGESRYGTQAVDTENPERIYEQQWALTLLGRVLERLQHEMTSKGKSDQFDVLKVFLSGTPRDGSLAAAAGQLGMSEGAAKVAAHRMRQRYRELLRGEIAATLADPSETEDEIRSLFAVLGG